MMVVLSKHRVLVVSGRAETHPETLFETPDFSGSGTLLLQLTGSMEVEQIMVIKSIERKRSAHITSLILNV